MGYPWTHLGAATVAVADQFVVSVDMKVGAYTLANAGAMPTAGARHVTVTHTAGDTVDTLGTITVTGRALSGQSISETIMPVANSTVTGTKWFASVNAPTGAGWVIDAAEGTKDTITVGCGADVIVAEGQGTLHAVVVNTTAAGTITLADAGGTIAVIVASITEGLQGPYETAFSGFLSVTLAAASDITVIHSGSMPQTYAMA